MKGFFFLALLFTSQVSASCSFEGMPPRSWLGEKTTLVAIKEHMRSRCIAVKKAVPVIETDCEKDQPIFKSKISNQGNIYWFSNSKRCHEKLAGMSGWVYEENGRLIEYYVYERS